MKAPSFKKSSDSGLSTLLAYQLGQKKNEDAKANLPPGAVPTKATIGGITYETPQSSDKVKENLNNVKLQREKLQSLKTSLNSVPQGRIRGGLSMLKSYITGGKGDEGSNSMFYRDNKPAIAVALYRDLTGDTRTSDADAASRALPLLPDQMEHPDLIQRKFDNLDSSLSLREQLLSSGKFQLDEQGNPLTPQTFQQALAGGSQQRVRVRNITTGQTGTIPESKFDSKKYERI